MKGCDYAAELMPAAMDGALGPEENEWLQSHLSRCEDCRELWEAMNAVSALLAQAPMAAPSPGFAERVMARVAGEASLRKKARIGGVLVFSAAYAEALALLVLGLTLGAALWLFPAKGMLLTLALRWLWRLSIVAADLVDVLATALKPALPPVALTSLTLCGMWTVVLLFLLRRYGLAAKSGHQIAH